jgi:hypothetical protein
MHNSVNVQSKSVFEEKTPKKGYFNPRGQILFFFISSIFGPFNYSPSNVSKNLTVIFFDSFF